MDCNTLHQAELKASYITKVWPMSTLNSVPNFMKAVIAVFHEGSDAP